MHTDADRNGPSAPPSGEAWDRGAEESAYWKVVALGMEPGFQELHAAAMDAFWGDAAERLDEPALKRLLALEPVEAAYTRWVFFDLPTAGDGRTVADRLLADRRARLTPAERRWIEAMVESHMAPYEVEAVRPGGELTLRDLWTGLVLDVRLGAVPELPVRWDVLAARVLPSEPGSPPVVERGAYRLPVTARGTILRTLRRVWRRFETHAPGAAPREFFKRQGYRFHHAWLEHVALRPPPPAAAPGLAAHRARQHHEWPDRALPALDGRTPREAARLAAWRPRVVDLLKWMENQEGHEAAAGEAPYDFDWIWRELDIEPGAGRGAGR